MAATDYIVGPFIGGLHFRMSPCHYFYKFQFDFKKENMLSFQFNEYPIPCHLFFILLSPDYINFQEKHYFVVLDLGVKNPHSETSSSIHKNTPSEHLTALT